MLKRPAKTKTPSRSPKRAASTSPRPKGKSVPQYTFVRETSAPKALTLDELDYNILSALRENGRTQNTAMAEEFGVSELTIATRLRRLTENGVVRATAQWDFASLGYQEVIFVDIYVRDRLVEEVAADIGKLEDSIVILGLVGEPQLKVMVAARDFQHRHDLLFGSIGKIPGISRTDITICLDIEKWRADYVLVL